MSRYITMQPENSKTTCSAQRITSLRKKSVKRNNMDKIDSFLNPRFGFRKLQRRKPERGNGLYGPLKQELKTRYKPRLPGS